jgi:hypothetical protein
MPLYRVFASVRNGLPPWALILATISRTNTGWTKPVFPVSPKCIFTATRSLRSTAFASPARAIRDPTRVVSEIFFVDRTGAK